MKGNSNYFGFFCAILMGISAFLPWTSFSQIFIKISYTGIDLEEGWIVVSLSIIAGILFMLKNKWAIIPGIVGILLGIYEIIEFNRQLGNIPENADLGFQAKVNYGLYMLLASTAGVVIFGYQLFKNKRQDEVGSSNESDVLT